MSIYKLQWQLLLLLCQQWWLPNFDIRQWLLVATNNPPLQPPSLTMSRGCKCCTSSHLWLSHGSHLLWQWQLHNWQYSNNILKLISCQLTAHIFRCHSNQHQCKEALLFHQNHRLGNPLISSIYSQEAYPNWKRKLGPPPPNAKNLPFQEKLCGWALDVQIPCRQDWK